MTDDSPQMPPPDPGGETEEYEGTLTETSETEPTEDDEETDNA